MRLNTEFIKKLMAEKSWSEHKLAEKSGLSQATVSRILSGKRGIGMKTFTSLKKALPEVAMKDLYFFDEDVTEW